MRYSIALSKFLMENSKMRLLKQASDSRSIGG